MNLFIPHLVYQITPVLFSIISGGFYSVSCFCLSFVIVEIISRWHCGCFSSLSYPCIFYTPPKENGGWFEASGSFLSCLLRLFEIKFKKRPESLWCCCCFFPFVFLFLLLPFPRLDKTRGKIIESNVYDCAWLPEDPYTQVMVTLCIIHLFIMSAQQKWSSSATFNFLFPHLNLFQYFHIFFLSTTLVEFCLAQSRNSWMFKWPKKVIKI